MIRPPPRSTLFPSTTLFRSAEQRAAESGRLQVLDWAGYGNDGGQAMFASYVKNHAANKPQFSYMTNESDALAKIHAGATPDLFRPYVGWVKYFATSGLVQPWDPSLISNFKHLNPFMVKAGQYGGKQYGIPDDWGFDAILYRTDKVTPKARSWSLIFDDRYKGKISWFDDLNMLTVAGLYLGFKDAWNQSDRVRLAERLGADEEERPESRVHAAEGEADRVGRDVHAAEDVAAAETRARLRRRVELDEVGEVARGQLRLRAREHHRPAGIERPAEGTAAHEPAGGHRAGRAPRP